MTTIIAFLFWWVTAAICWFVPDAREPANNGNQQITSPAVAEAVQLEMPVAATETTTQRLEEDGTMVIEQIVTRPDGSKTATTSRIPPAAATCSIDANFEKR